MHEQSFWKLHRILEQDLKGSKKRKRGRAPNGDISSSARLSMAIRWFASGDKFDIGPHHGVHENEVMESLGCLRCSQHV